MMKLNRVLLAVAVTFLSVTLAAQQTPSVQVRVDAVVGFNGLTKAGRWTPVRIQMQNLGAGIRGTLAVSVDRSDRIGPVQQTVSVSRPLDLPAGTTKAFEFVLPVTSSIYPIDVSVYDTPQTTGEPILTQSVDLSGRSTRGLLVVALARRANLDFLMSELNRSDERTVDVAYAIPEYLPSSWIGLDAVDLVAIHEARLEAVTSDQWEALRIWIANGGTLVVSGGEHQLVQSSRYVMRLVQSDLSRVDGETPAVTTVGAGRVIVLPFDYAAYHREFPQASLALWEALLGTGDRMVEVPIIDRRRIFEHELIADVLAIPSFRFPSKLVLLSLVGVYLLAIAATGYFAFVRRHVPTWRFLSIIVAASLFAAAGGALVLGKGSRPDRALQLSFERTTTSVGSGFAEVGTDVVLFSRNAASYGIAFENDVTPVPLVAENLDLWVTPAQTQITVDVARWGHRNVWLRTVKEFRVDGSVRREDGALRLELTNGTSQTLEHAVVLFQGSPESIGTIGSAQSATVDLPRDVELDQVRWEYLVPAGSVQQHQAQILENLARRQRFETSDADQLVVVAWLDEPLVPTLTTPPFERELPIQMVVIRFPYEVWT